MNYSQRVKKLYAVKHLLGEFLPAGRRFNMGVLPLQFVLKGKYE